MIDEKFDEKFNYIIKDTLAKLKITDLYPYTEKDLNTIKKFENLIETKKIDKCKAISDEFSKYSINYSQFGNFSDVQPNKENLKEYEETKQKFEECLKPFDKMQESISINKKLIEQMTSNTLEKCVDNVKLNTKAGNLNEIQARGKLEFCYTHFLVDKNSNSLILNNIFEPLSKMYLN
jgi:hypothetical protein